MRRLGEVGDPLENSPQYNMGGQDVGMDINAAAPTSLTTECCPGGLQPGGWPQ